MRAARLLGLFNLGGGAADDAREGDNALKSRGGLKFIEKPLRVSTVRCNFAAIINQENANQSYKSKALVAHREQFSMVMPLCLFFGHSVSNIL